MGTVHADIADALYHHLSRWSWSPPVVVAWPDREFEPRGRDHLRVKNYPAEPTQVSFGEAGFNRHTGVLQISLFRVEDQGEIGALEIVDGLVTHFRRGTAIRRNGRVVEVYQPPAVAASLQEPGWLHFPVTVRWRSDNPNL